MNCLSLDSFSSKANHTWWRQFILIARKFQLERVQLDVIYGRRFKLALKNFNSSSSASGAFVCLKQTEKFYVTKNLKTESKTDFCPSRRNLQLKPLFITRHFPSTTSTILLIIYFVLLKGDERRSPWKCQVAGNDILLLELFLLSLFKISVFVLVCF